MVIEIVETAIHYDKLYNLSVFTSQFTLYIRLIHKHKSSDRIACQELMGMINSIQTGTAFSFGILINSFYGLLTNSMG